MLHNLQHIIVHYTMFQNITKWQQKVFVGENLVLLNIEIGINYPEFLEIFCSFTCCEP